MPATKTKPKAVAAPTTRSIEDLASEITQVNRKIDECTAHRANLQQQLRERLVAVGICEEVPQRNPMQLQHLLQAYYNAAMPIPPSEQDRIT